MRARSGCWRIGGMVALCAIAGCFERLPEASSCDTTADCLLGERCAANLCITTVIIDEPDQATDMQQPDLDAPDLSPTPDMALDMPDMASDMSAGPTTMLIQLQDAESPGTFVPDVPVCIFSSSFVDIMSAGAAVTRLTSDANGVVTLQVEAAGLAPAMKYRIWTGLAETGEGDTTSYIPYDAGEVHTFPTAGMMKTVTIDVTPCDNSVRGKECPETARCLP